MTIELTGPVSVSQPETPTRWAIGVLAAAVGLAQVLGLCVLLAALVLLAGGDDDVVSGPADTAVYLPRGPAGPFPSSNVPLAGPLVPGTTALGPAAAPIPGVPTTAIAGAPGATSSGAPGATPPPPGRPVAVAATTTTSRPSTATTERRATATSAERSTSTTRRRSTTTAEDPELPLGTCPTGGASWTSEFVARDEPVGPGATPVWTVQVKGKVVNNVDATIRLDSIEIEVVFTPPSGSPEQSPLRLQLLPDRGTVKPRQTVRFAGAVRLESTDEPRDGAMIVDINWENERLREDCDSPA